MPGNTKSSVNLPWPVTSRGSSRRLIPEPKMREAMGLPRHLSRRLLDGGDDVLVARAAAVVPLQPVADLGLAGLGVPLEDVAGGQDHPGGAEAALEAVLLPEGFLEGVELAVGQALDRGHARPVRLDGEHRAGLHGLTVQEHRARPALARVAADVGAGEPQRFAQEVNEELPGLDLAGFPGAVHCDGNRDLHGHLADGRGRQYPPRAATVSTVRSSLGAMTWRGDVRAALGRTAAC